MYGVCTFRVHADKLVKEIDNHHESERAGEGGGVLGTFCRLRESLGKLQSEKWREGGCWKY